MTHLIPSAEAHPRTAQARPFATDGGRRVFAPVTAAPPDALQPALLARALDEVDHGLILLDLTGRVVHANHPARRELTAAHALHQGRDGQLCAGDAAAQSRIRAALRDAEHDLRRIVELPHPQEPLSLAFVPLAAPQTPVDTVLVILSRRVNTQSLTLQMFAQARQLTHTEHAVLAQLCAGHGAEYIARLHGVCLSTVRTHIKNLRQKTGAASIREMVHRMLHMPQIMPAVRWTDVLEND